MPYVLQDPESTQTTTSGGSPGGAPGGAPDGAKDVADKVTGKQVVDDSVDWASAGEPDDFPSDEAPPNEETPAGDTSTGDEDEPQPSPSKKTPPAKKPGEDTVPGAGDEPDTGKPGEEEQPGDEPAPKPPAKVDEPPQETAEQKAERERLQQEAEEKDFNALKEYYKLPDDYVERLRTEPELIMPELAAKVHQAVYRGMQQYITQAIPNFLTQHSQLQEANTKAKEAFFGRWPSLKGHEERVLQVGAMFRQLNPKATPQERLEQVGKMACMALNIEPDPAPGGEDSPQPRPKVGAPKKKQAVRPANPSGSSAGTPPPSDNVYTEIAEEFLAEDRGE